MTITIINTDFERQPLPCAISGHSYGPRLSAIGSRCTPSPMGYSTNSHSWREYHSRCDRCGHVHIEGPFPYEPRYQPMTMTPQQIEIIGMDEQALLEKIAHAAKELRDHKRWYGATVIQVQEAQNALSALTASLNAAQHAFNDLMAAYADYIDKNPL